MQGGPVGGMQAPLHVPECTRPERDDGVEDSEDFEYAWRAKFAAALNAILGAEKSRQVMDIDEGAALQALSWSAIAWTTKALQRLEALAGEGQRREILAACACQYPRRDLQPIRAVFEETEDISAAHAALQAQFEAFLRRTLQLEEVIVQEVVGRGWGAAGAFQGRTITATKIPKSGFLRAYLRESDPQRKRELYCHCPRVRGVVAMGLSLPDEYCCCGAGFYQGIWEEILQRHIHVEVVHSVLRGDDVCTFDISLSES
jgi:predicted hydrocarbon binding protein